MSKEQSSFFIKILNIAYFNTKVMVTKGEVRSFLQKVEKISEVKNSAKSQESDNNKTVKKKKSQSEKTNRKIIERGIIDEKSREIALLYVNFKNYP